MPDLPPGWPETLHEPVLTWYAAHARDLPWRAPTAGPWAVLVSEVMLAQTPVARVLPAYAAWLARWPTPAALAAAPPGEAVRQWGRLGYPRRALWLHATAELLHDRYEGEVPAEPAALRALPGVGDYTAAAVASFAFGQRHPVVDTNVRRVLTRVVAGQAAAPAPRAAHTRLAAALLPDEPRVAARWGAALMELGALVCTARAPRCPACPLTGHCAWRAAGRPAPSGPVPRRPAYAGSDRQARGALLAAAREARGPVAAATLARAWPVTGQRRTALAGLLRDGLLERRGGRYQLPGAQSR